MQHVLGVRLVAHHAQRQPVNTGRVFLNQLRVRGLISGLQPRYQLCIVNSGHYALFTLGRYGRAPNARRVYLNAGPAPAQVRVPNTR